MWRRHLTIGLLTIIVGIWFASWEAHTPYLSSLQKYEGGDNYQELVRTNIRKHLRNHHRLLIKEGELQIAALTNRILNVGQRFLVMFSAQQEAQKNSLPDLYVMQVNMGANAYPLSFTPPRNLTSNSLSEDRLFGVGVAQNEDEDRGVHILYGQLDAQQACRSINYLWWPDGASDEDDSFSLGLFSDWLASWENAHYFDRSNEPQWQVLRFDQPLADCRASLGIEGTKDRGDHKFQVFSGKKLEFTVDTVTFSTVPIRSGVELISSHKQSTPILNTLQRTLRVYDLLNLDEDLRLSSLHADFVTSFKKNIYELILSGSADNYLAPVDKVSSILDSRRPTWYPPRIDVKPGLEDEGVWRPLRVRSGSEPLILKTFIRLDPEHPYHTIHLYALDMRRLGLKFIAGADLKALHFEGVGSSRIRSQDQPQVVAAFSGGPVNRELIGRQNNTKFYPHGVIENYHELAPMSEGLPTVALDNRGRIALGRLDVAQVPHTWSSMRQSYAPLVDLRMNDRNFVPPQSPKGRLDSLHLTRSALGINQQGTLIFAWSEATTTEYLAQALKLVGVKFAMSLRTLPDQNGMAVYPDPSLGDRMGRERPANFKMKVDPKVWRESATEDFFYVVLAQSLPGSFPKRSADWSKGEGEWRPVKYQDIDPWLAKSFVSAKNAGSFVELLRVDGERLRINLALGGHRAPQFFEEERPLAAQPVARIPIGLATQRLGVTVLGESQHQAQVGKMTWGVDDQGRSVIDRWGQGEMGVDRIWRDLLQGETIIENGEISSPAQEIATVKLDAMPEEARAQSDDSSEIPPVPEVEPFQGGPISALGITREGDIIFAYNSESNLTAVQSAMISAGVQRALRLNYRGTAQTGESQFFYSHQGQTFYNIYPDLALKPAFLQTPKSALIGLEDSLILTTRASDPRARFVESFNELTNQEE
jgi:hypothetical protein